jgi:hypothetical protein
MCEYADVQIIKTRHAELVSASHMLSDQHIGYLYNEIPKQVRDDGNYLNQPSGLAAFYFLDGIGSPADV